MSLKSTIKKEDLVKGTIKIIRDEGIEKLSARNLAKVCNCSTQPIFRLFKNMEDLKNTVYNDVNEIQKKYLTTEEKHSIPLINIGLSYIDFATKEKNLFKFLYMTDASKSINIIKLPETEEINKYIDNIVLTTGLSKESSKQLFINTWLIIHGIASIVSTTNSKLSKTEIETIIFDAFKGYRQALMNKELNSKYKKL